MRLWRPFPYSDLRETVKNARTLIVLDRAISFGQEGPVASEIKSALYPLEKRPKVVGFVGGLGGRDVSPSDFEEIINRGIEIAGSGSQREFEIYGVRG
jgi:pyruvate ferredoxin oxidoreductase alpha subunit